MRLTNFVKGLLIGLVLGFIFGKFGGGLDV